jgi:hypothetical protein
MNNTLHRMHLRELEVGEERVARGKEIILRHKELAGTLKAMGAQVQPENDKLLELLEISQQLAEDHLALVRRALERGE